MKMVKTIPIVIFLLGFVVFTIQWNYNTQKSKEDLYDLRGILNKLGIKSIDHRVFNTTPKNHGNKNKHISSDEETQNFNQKVLNALFKSDRSETTSIENIRCKAGRCGCGKGGLRCRDNKNVNMVYKDGIDQLLNELRREVEDDKSNKSKNKLRCNSVNGRCGRERIDNENINNNDIIKRGTLIEELNRHGKKYKINDDMDAIVLDLSHLDNLLSNLNNSCLDGKCNDDLDEVSKSGKGVKKLQSNLDVETINMAGEQTDDTFTQQLKDPFVDKFKKDPTLNPEDLFIYYQFYKTLIIEKIMDYIKGKNYRKTEIQNITEKQKQLIDNVKHLSQNSDSGLNEKEIKKQIAGIIFGKHSLYKVVPHNENNNNVYVPEWFYKKVLKTKDIFNVRTHKRLLPLTLQQRQRKARNVIRRWRRDSGLNVENYGVPFELNVQGLGQVIP